MRYTVKQYAEGLLRALQGKTEKQQGEVIKRFMALLQKNGAFQKRKEILKEAERQYLKQEKVKKVSVELASETPSGLQKEIEGALGTKIIFESSVNKNILGGIKILIDDETLIDASARTQIAKLLGSKVKV